MTSLNHINKMIKNLEDKEKELKSPKLRIRLEGGKNKREFLVIVDFKFILKL